MVISIQTYFFDENDFYTVIFKKYIYIYIFRATNLVATAAEKALSD